MSAPVRLLMVSFLVAFLIAQTSPVGSALPAAPVPSDPYALVSQESLLAYLQALTAIQPYSGWRNSASSGEVEALDYVAKQLRGFSYLKNAGLEQERQSFSVYLSTEIWDSRLSLTVNGRQVEVPADGLRGSRGYRPLAVYFDSDGVFNDSNRNPLTAEGAPLLVEDDSSLYALAADQVAGRILWVNYALLDYFLNQDALANGSQLNRLIDQGAAGVVLLTQYSNQRGESRGTGVGDGAMFLYETPSRRVPILYARLEDLAPAGIASWDDLSKITTARLDVDCDLYSPGKGGNLIARIPGADASRAVILGAHIDSPNSPGAFDDGSGSAALLEVARVLDASQVRPPVDVYLAWFGGHEIGTYGSAHFAATHQELLDRTLALVVMDGLGYPLEGRPSRITLMATSYGKFGEQRTPLPDFLIQAAASNGVSIDALVEYGLIADNSNFDAFNVPNVYLGYFSAAEYHHKGSSYIHFSNHWHDPYETAALAGEIGEVFVSMTKVLLTAALETGRAPVNLRVTPGGAARALFVGSHTEPECVSTSMLRDLGMAFAWEGFDVDLLPYAQPLTAADLRNVSAVVLPPTLDLPGKHNERWSPAELALLDEYVRAGGFLVVVNSACNYLIKRCLDDDNEDRHALNDFLEPMGLTFTYGGGISDKIALATGEHPLTANATYLSFYEGQNVPFRMTSGLELVQAQVRPLVGLLDHGQQGGQVLVIGDLGLLQVDRNAAKNQQFLQNIARYARER